ncbi:MAG: MFS transporter [Chloroflexi bacterium]|nr:MFS transporter [Chloroflexota bacterium]
MPPKLTGLWRNPDFLKLWSAETISLFGSLVSRTVLPFTAILALEATPWQMALLGAADLVPGLLLGLVAGVWADRLRRRPILVAADIGRAALLSTIPAAALLGVLRMEQLYLVAFLTGVLTIFFDVAYLSYLPSLVRPEELVEGNSKLAASGSVVEVSAFALAGWLVQWLTAPVAVLIDALSFLWSALFLGMIRTPERPPQPEEGRQGMRREALEGLGFVVRDPLLRAAAASSVVLDFSFRMVGTVILLYTARELGFETGVLGMIFAVGGVSSLAGALVAERATRRLGVGGAMVLGLALTGLAVLLLPLAPGATAVGAALLVGQQLLGDGAYTLYSISQVTLRQSVTPPPLLGRVNGSIRVLGLGAMLLGALAGGLLAEAAGLRWTLVAAAGGVLLAALGLALSPVWGLRSFPQPRDAAGERA